DTAGVDAEFTPVLMLSEAYERVLFGQRAIGDIKDDLCPGRKGEGGMGPVHLPVFILLDDAVGGGALEPAPRLHDHALRPERDPVALFVAVVDADFIKLRRVADG